MKRAVGGPMLGGRNDADVGCEMVNNATQFAVQKMNAGSNGFYQVKLAQVTAATKQLVAGVVFRVTFDVQVRGCNISTVQINKYCKMFEARILKKLKCFADIGYLAVKDAWFLRQYMFG